MLRFGVGFFARAKSAALEQAVRSVLGAKIARYGELRNFSIDIDQRRFTAEVLLHGETEPVCIPEGRYRLEDRGGEPFVVLHGIRISRAWAQNALDDFAPELAFKVPDFARSLL